MKKLMVIVKHLESNGYYLFLVPPEAIRLSAGQLVMCETKKGEQYGICMCDSFVADIEKVCKYFNTNPKSMKYIVAEYSERRYPIPAEVCDEDGQQE